MEDLADTIDITKHSMAKVNVYFMGYIAYDEYWKFPYCYLIQAEWCIYKSVN